MKIFISFRFNGEDPHDLDRDLSAIKLSMEKAGHDVSCTLWDEEMFQREKYDHRQIFGHGLRYLDSADAILAYINSVEKSEGMLLEIGYALAKEKKIIVAARNGVEFRFTRALADDVISFSSIEDLCEKLKII